MFPINRLAHIFSLRLVFHIIFLTSNILSATKFLLCNMLLSSFWVLHFYRRLWWFVHMERLVSLNVWCSCFILSLEIRIASFGTGSLCGSLLSKIIRSIFGELSAVSYGQFCRSAKVHAYPSLYIRNVHSLSGWNLLGLYIFAICWTAIQLEMMRLLIMKCQLWRGVRCILVSKYTHTYPVETPHNLMVIMQYQYYLPKVTDVLVQVYQWRLAE